MNCDEVRRHWHLYYDSEGDAEVFLRINEHLEACPECAEWFRRQNEFEDRMERHLGRQPPTPELWQFVCQRTGLGRPVSPDSSKTARLLFAAAGVLAASLLVAALGWYFSGGRDGQSAEAPHLADTALTQLTAGCHEELVQGNKSVEFTSRSDLEVEDYIRQRVNFPVRCPPRKDTGFLVEGTGVCRVADRQAAYLVGRLDDKRISIFILPQEVLSHYPDLRRALRQGGPHRERRDGYEIVMNRVDRNVVVVIGRTQARHLVRVLEAYGTYPEGHHG